jgi:hypothetical protein
MVVTDGPMPVGRLYPELDGLPYRIVRSRQYQVVAGDIRLLQAMRNGPEPERSRPGAQGKLFFRGVCGLLGVGGAPELETAIEAVHL